MRTFQHPIPRAWKYRLAPDTPSARRPMGLPGLWTRLRRLLWSWWLWAAIAIVLIWNDVFGWAVGAGITAAVAYLLQPTEFPPAYGLEHELRVDDPDFVSSLVGTTGTPFLGGNRVDILNNGDEFYPAMLDAIRGAARSITVEAYIYWDGNIGREFADALAERAKAGVRVKLLLDAVGSSRIGEEILARLDEGGCQVAWFNPPHWYSIGRFNHRTHRKSLIVDGRIGFTGGAGIADQWSGRAQDEDHWRDMQIRLEGAGVLPLQTGFAQNWLQATGELVSGDAFFPLLESDAPGVYVHTMLSSPSTGTSAARVLYYLSISAARRRILIANPYFVPDPSARDTLIAARRRGVHVAIMMAGRHNDAWLVRQNSIRLAGRLLEAGITIHEYNRTMLHHKMMVVDDDWATIGTTNFDNRSFAFNEESNVSFNDPDLVRQLADTFHADLDGCDRLTLEAWRRRGVGNRAKELVASLMQDQI
ncbi:MAG TPA: phospholipase D-like domain-containing protein [Vicinamibacterales bacterium]